MRAVTVSTPVQEFEGGVVGMHNWKYDGTLVTTVNDLCIGSLDVLRHLDKGWRFYRGDNQMSRTLQCGVLPTSRRCFELGIRRNMVWAMHLQCVWHKCESASSATRCHAGNGHSRVDRRCAVVQYLIVHVEVREGRQPSFYPTLRTLSRHRGSTEGMLRNGHAAKHVWASQHCTRASAAQHG